MQEINLLQSKLKDRTYASDKRNAIILGIAGFITILVFVAGGVLYMANKDKQRAINGLKKENESIQSKLDSAKGDLSSAKSFQAQLKNIEKLMALHIYWSPVLERLEANALKNGMYISLQATSNGKVHVEGLTDSMVNVGKLILSLSTDKSNFYDVKLSSIKRNEGAISAYNFEVDFMVKPESLIKK
jgi:hypothetical protein